MKPLKPSWLDDTFLTKVLQSVEETRQEIQVTSCGCEAAVAPGTNYLSSLYRLHVEYKVGDAGHVSSVSLIVKTPLEEHGFIRDFIETTGGYRKEVKFYNEILPRMKQVHTSNLTAQSYPCPLDSSLVLEDLKASGFKMADRLERLDLEHCRQSLITLAKFHAISIAVLHNQPDLIQTSGRNYFFNDQGSDEERAERRTSSDGCLTLMLKTVEDLEGCGKFTDLLRETMKTSWDKVSELHRPRKLLNVLLHGDCWTNNILFKYDEDGNIVDTRLVDFQLIGFGSFALDVIFFWWVSANEDVRRHHRETLFEEYRQTLNKTLVELECKESITKEEFDCEMKMFAPYSLYVMCLILPFAMADPDNLIDPNKSEPAEGTDEKTKEEHPQMPYFTGKYYRAVLPSLLDQAEKFGAFC